jgi:penicillin-binding protein 1A
LFPRLGRKAEGIFYSKVIDRDGRVLEEIKPKVLPSEVKIPPLPPAPIEVPTEGEVAATDPAAAPTPLPVSQSAEALKPIPLPSYPPTDDPEQVLDPRVAYVMTHLMKEVVNYGTGYEARSLGRAAAGKTGTTNEYNDAWFMGFTPNIVTGVWVGFDNQKQMGPLGTGAKAALPIWLGYMTEAVKLYPEGDFPVPPGVVFASIDPNTGRLAPSNSSRSIKEAFIEGTQPTESSDPLAKSQDSQTEFFKEDLE